MNYPASDVPDARQRPEVAPDASLGWLRRLAPLVGRHRALLAVSLVAAFIALGVQVAVPAVIAAAMGCGMPAGA